MPKFRDEKEYSQGNVIKERPSNKDRDDVAVYGSEDDDVVTGDEMDNDGNYDPESGLDQGNGDGDDSGLDNIQFNDDESEDELDGFEDDSSLEDEGEDLGDGEGLEDDSLETDSSDKGALFDQLQDLLKQIVNFSDDESLEDMPPEKLGEAFESLFLGEDHALKVVSNQFAESNDFEATDVFDVIEALRTAEASTEPTIDYSTIEESSDYLCQLVEYKDTKVINIIEKVLEENLEEAKSDAVTSNNIWSSFKKSYAETLEDPEANLGGERSKDEERQFLEDLNRKQGVINGSEVIQYIKESTQNPRMFVFAVEEIQGESLVSKKQQIAEDAKSLANKTRKTHKVNTADMPYLFDKILSSVLDVQFKGKIKPFTQIHKDLKSSDQKSGHKGGRAAARRGDKVSNGMKNASKVEAVKALINVISEMDDRQVSGILKAFETDTKPSDIVESSTKRSLEEDFNALQIAAEGEGLSESFLKDVKLIMETAYKTRMDDAAKALEIHYNNKLREAVDKTQDNIVEQLDTYLDYVADNFMKENKLAIEEGIRTEISESLLENIFRVFKEHNITVPEGKTNLLESKEQETDQLEEELQRTANIAISYKDQAVNWMRVAIVEQAKAGLTVKEGNELERRAANITKFDDENDFRSKVEDIKRLYFNDDISENKRNININNEEDGTLLETSEHTSQDHGTLMESYVNASRYISKNR